MGIGVSHLTDVKKNKVLLSSCNCSITRSTVVCMRFCNLTEVLITAKCNLAEYVPQRGLYLEVACRSNCRWRLVSRLLATRCNICDRCSHTVEVACRSNCRWRLGSRLLATRCNTYDMC